MEKSMKTSVKTMKRNWTPPHTRDIRVRVSRNTVLSKIVFIRQGLLG